MGLIKCRNKRHDCGQPFPSTCVSYEGDFVGVLDSDDFSCDINLDDVIEKLSTVIKTIDDKVTTIDGRVTVLESDILEIRSDIEDIRDSVTNIDTNNIFVTMDLGCLSSDAAPCETTPNRYSLFSILQLFKNEICLLKA